MKIKNRIEKLKKEMKNQNIDAYIIPNSDPHMSEYLAGYFMGIEWLLGFTGSAGTLVITQDISGLWTDGRYFIQAEKQLKDTGIELFKAGMEGVPNIDDWLMENLAEDKTVGMDGRLFSLTYVRKMAKKFKGKGIRMNKNLDILDFIWGNRPKLPDNPIFLYDTLYAGKSAIEKLQEVREIMEEKGANYYLLPNLDDIAWLYNIRGRDIDYNPVAIAYALVSMDKAWLFIDRDKVSRDIEMDLMDKGIEIKPYENIYKDLSNLREKDAVLFDPNRTNTKLYESIGIDAKSIEEPSIVTRLKAVKNSVEIKNLKDAHIKDGTAMVKFLCWLDRNIKGGQLTEITIADKLEELRREQENFIDLSFPTIAGYKDHGAIVHYRATNESAYKLKTQGMVLIDSGGQYLDGTTDITRTVILGEITDEERRDYTLVLKGNINLAMAKFLQGATGASLDILARKPLWDKGIDYKHGTGHGVGHFLSVHEGPQGISRAASKVKLTKGMVVTNEPGIYREGSHGIRIENELLIIEDKKTEFGEFLKFEVITYCPIDIRGIDINILNEEEREWLNSYHKMVYNKLECFLTIEERAWLQDKTKAI